MLFDAISCFVWMNTTIIILLQVTASRDSMKFAPKIGVASMTISIGYSTTTRAVWVILLEHEGRRPEGESNITHTARKVVV